MDITLIFFFYGLAFFSMGLAMAFEARRSPLLAEGRVLLPLAFFGLVHGGHEWFEMFLDRSDWWQTEKPEVINWLRIIILTISFMSLCIFAWRSINPQKTFSKRELLLWRLGFLVYISGVILFAYYSGRSHPDGLTHIDAFVRLLVAVPGAVMAGVAINFQARDAKNQGRADLGAVLNWAALGFVLYGCTQVFVPALDVFPATILNAPNFIAWTGVPIQLIRAFMALIIMISLVSATQKVEVERQANFLREQQARLEAVEQLRYELLEREKLRQDLLRHIVIAQEDERARIARELHDETSQILTGFSLHLAALDETMTQYPQAHQQILHLQTLSKQISQGLYRLVRDLRPAQLDDLGLIAALNFLVGDVRKRLNLKVHLQIIGNHQRLDPLVETVFFRIAQEALTNAARHAHTGEAQVRIQFDEDAIVLEVSDQGVGFSPEVLLSSPDGYGLTGMIERAESVGGKLEIMSEPQRGTSIKMGISTQKAQSKVVESI